MYASFITQRVRTKDGIITIDDKKGIPCFFMPLDMSISSCVICLLFLSIDNMMILSSSVSKHLKKMMPYFLALTSQDRTV
jgi:hypothetical protein